MSIITENNTQTPVEIIEENGEHGNSDANDDNLRLPSSQDDQGEHSINGSGDIRVSKEKVRYSFHRDATASIADALLRLESSKNGGNASSHHHTKNRKRTVSFDTDTDTDTETDSAISVKRPKKISSDVLDKRPSHEETFFSTNQNFNKTKIQGEIGCISQSLHQCFLPLAAAPRLPTGIVAECPPPIMSHPTCSHRMPPTLTVAMTSAVSTEHNGCFIMHSYMHTSKKKSSTSLS